MPKFKDDIANLVRRSMSDDFVRANLMTQGEVFYVVEDSDPDWSRLVTRFGKKNVHTTLEAAYAACTSNRNDIILLSGHTTHAVSTGIAWSKNRIHVVGMDGGQHAVQQGTKIELSGAVASAYVLKVTGVRNTFKNLKVIQSSTDGTALNVVQYAGEGTAWENCSFLFGVANNLGSTSAAEALMGEDAGTFTRCSWGTDVLLNTAARNIMAFDAISSASSADGAKSNRFFDCEWLVMSSSASAVLLKVVDTAGAKFLNEFVNPRFMAVVSSGGGGIAITNAVQSVASFVDGSFHFIRPTTNACTNFCDTLTSQFTISGAPVFGAGTHEGGTPT